MPRRTLVLLQPKIGDMDDFRDRPTPPMSLIHAATFLRDDYHVVLVDQRVEEDWRATLRDALAACPVAVGITTLTGPMIRNALEMARFVKEHSAAPLLWGGTHMTMLPRQAIGSELVDYLVLGEGEFAFKELVDALAGGRPGRDLPGVWAKDNGRIVRNDRAPVLDYAGLPLAPYDLVDMERYAYTSRGRRALDYLSSRGCPHRCAYCYNNVFYGRKWSAKPADVVAAELTELHRRYDFDVVYFLDDNFFIDRKRAFDIAATMKKLGIEYEIQGVDIQSMAALSDDELAHLEDTGLIKLTIGIESATDRVRREIGKWGDVDSMRAALYRLAGRRFIVLTSFIIGFPFETWEEIEQTIEFAVDLQRKGDNFRLPQFYNFTPVQGTPLAVALEEEGFRFPQSIDDWENVDWDRYTLFGADSGRTRKLEAIAFLSKFIDRKYKDYGARSFVSLLYRLYRPVATVRLSRRLYSFLPEKSVYEILKRLV